MRWKRLRPGVSGAKCVREVLLLTWVRGALDTIPNCSLFLRNQMRTGTLRSNPLNEKLHTRSIYVHLLGSSAMWNNSNCFFLKRCFFLCVTDAKTPQSSLEVQRGSDAARRGESVASARFFVASGWQSLWRLLRESTPLRDPDRNAKGSGGAAWSSKVTEDSHCQGGHAVGCVRPLGELLVRWSSSRSPTSLLLGQVPRRFFVVMDGGVTVWEDTLSSS